MKSNGSSKEVLEQCKYSAIYTRKPDVMSKDSCDCQLRGQMSMTMHTCKFVELYSVLTFKTKNTLEWG